MTHQAKDEDRQGGGEVRVRERGYIFVDDGYPEAADYENNYITYDRRQPGSFDDALRQASGHRANAAAPGARARGNPPRTVRLVRSDRVLTVSSYGFNSLLFNC